MSLNKNEKVAVFVAVALAFAFILSSSGYFAPKNISLNNISNEANGGSTAGLVISDLSEGTGAVASQGAKITVHYTGSLQDGTIFDSSVQRGMPFTFTLGQGEVIAGWDKGLMGMKVGGQRLLTISPELGYGAQEVGPIPANSTLVFQVELLSVEEN